ncbi:MAG TPA: hypothetical protein VFW31_14670 [Candidatus Angelobacter sp.]|nr:hypothetical protein [Candidatus Angelobacter sp.]
MRKSLTKEQIVAAIKRSSSELGRSPTMEELARKFHVCRGTIQKKFGSYSMALEMAGLGSPRNRIKYSMKDLFLDWAGIARRLKKLPTVEDFNRETKYSIMPLSCRIGRWLEVPMAMQAFAEEEGLTAEWRDVMEMIADHTGRVALGSTRTNFTRLRGAVMQDRPVFGPPVARGPLLHWPTNENGVIYLFGALAERMGFVASLIRTGFPDCEALREVRPDEWQRVLIEFEYDSRSFVAHKHNPKKCDIIVCWIHNWKSCPLEVIELRRMVDKYYWAGRGK